MKPGDIVNYFPMIGVRKSQRHAGRIRHRVYLIVSMENGKSKVAYIEYHPQRRVWVQTRKLRAL